MRIAIVGGHGQIARRLTRLLHANGHETVSIIRNPDHADDVRAVGGEPRVVDLESASIEQLAETFEGCQAVVFAAGAGPGSGAPRKLTVDRDGAVKTADATDLAGVGRLVVVSAIDADRADRDADDVFQVYLAAKADADADIRSRVNLDFTIVRPGTLTDDPGTGLVAVGEDLGRGSVSRDDVAATVLAVIERRAAVRHQFDLVAGSTPIVDALRQL